MDAPLSITALSLVPINQLFQRARQHGLSSLISKRSYLKPLVAGSDGGRNISDSEGFARVADDPESGPNSSASTLRKPLRKLRERASSLSGKGNARNAKHSQYDVPNLPGTSATTHRETGPMNAGMKDRDDNTIHTAEAAASHTPLYDDRHEASADIPLKTITVRKDVDVTRQRRE